MGHKLQLCMYAWLWKQVYPDDNKSFKLFNIYTCEILELDSSHYALNDIIEVLIENKLQQDDRKGDDEFIRMCLEEIEEIPLIENNYRNEIEGYLLDGYDEEE